MGKKRTPKQVFDLAARAAFRVTEKHFEALSDDELTEFRERAYALSTTNCWCAIYWLRKFLIEAVEGEMWQRHGKPPPEIREHHGHD